MVISWNLPHLSPLARIRTLEHRISPFLPLLYTSFLCGSSFAPPLTKKNQTCLKEIKHKKMRKQENQDERERERETWGTTKIGKIDRRDAPPLG